MFVLMPYSPASELATHRLPTIFRTTRLPLWIGQRAADVEG